MSARRAGGARVPGRPPLALGVLLAFACGGGSSVPPGTDTGHPPPTAEEEESPFPADLPADRLRGRVLDRRTAQGLPDLWVRLRRRGETSLVRTDERGYFFADRALPQGMVGARVGIDEWDPRLEPGLLRLEHDPATAAEVRHVLRVDAGPGYRLEFLPIEVRNPERWKARLVERDDRGSERAWSWRALRPGEPPWLRYETVEHEPDPRYSARIELRLEGGAPYSRAAVSRTIGVAEEPVRFVLSRLAAFGGEVIDPTGRPVVDARVSLRQLTGGTLPVVSDAWRSAYTLRSGVFLFEHGVEPGRYRVRVASAGREDVDFILDLEEEGITGYRIRLKEVPIAGAVSGELRTDGAGGTPLALLSLRSTDGGGVGRWLHPLEKEPLWGSLTAEEARLSFTFEDLPVGRYELELFSLDGRPWEPRALELEAPATGLSFTAGEGAPPVAYSFDVRDRATGEALSECRVVFRAPGWWNPEGLLLAPGSVAARVSPETGLTWMVYQPGFRPSYGDLPHAVEGAALEIPVELERGWGAELWLRDVGGGADRPELDTWATMALVHQASPVPGVPVRGDGVVLGVSDGSGVVRVSLEAAPGRLEVGGAEWEAIDSAFFAGGRLLPGSDTGGATREYRSVPIWLRRRGGD